MYALDIYRYEDSAMELIRTEFFDTLDEAVSATESLKSDGVRMAVFETTGEPGDEGKVVASY